MTEKTPVWQRWLVLCTAALAVGLTGSLGLWQLDRAAQKTDLPNNKTKQAAMQALDGRTLGEAHDSEQQRAGLIYRRITLVGRWLPQHTVYLENRQMNAKPGFFVLTPFQIQGSGAVLLVQRQRF